MTELTLIQKAQHGRAHGTHSHVHLSASRATLAKRRWRGVAEDGREFGFDLDETLEHGDHFFADGDCHYVIEQEEEQVLEIPVGTVEQAARIAWSLGNLHFGLQVLEESVRVVEDPAVLQLLAREHVTFKKVSCIFRPLSAGASHHHGDHHHHA